VLIIDDNFLIAERLSRLVRSEDGLGVEPATTWQGACAFIRGRPVLAGPAAARGEARRIPRRALATRASEAFGTA
jgi:hypothetical protein